MLALATLMLRRRRSIAVAGLAGMVAGACATASQPIASTDSLPTPPAASVVEPVKSESPAVTAPEVVAPIALAKTVPSTETAPSGISTPPLKVVGQRTTLQKGETWTAPDGTTVFVKDVWQRGEPCPAGARCIHAGIIREAVLVVTAAGTGTELVLRERASGLAAGWAITAAEVAPPAVTLLVVRQG
jgi:hypothetical protein